LLLLLLLLLVVSELKALIGDVAINGIVVVAC
jgi:hypothetical protein